MKNHRKVIAMATKNKKYLSIYLSIRLPITYLLSTYHLSVIFMSNISSIFYLYLLCNYYTTLYLIHHLFSFSISLHKTVSNIYICIYIQIFILILISPSVLFCSVISLLQNICFMSQVPLYFCSYFSTNMLIPIAVFPCQASLQCFL